MTTADPGDVAIANDEVRCGPATEAVSGSAGDSEPFIDHVACATLIHDMPPQRQFNALV